MSQDNQELALRFKNPRPAFQAPQTDHLAVKVKDNIPATSLLNLAKSNGESRLADILATASKAAKDQALVISICERRAAKKKQPTSVSVSATNDTSPKFSPSDVVNDEEFIKRTRSGSYHTPELKALFYANGGDKYLTTLSYAAAYEAIRRDKMKNIRKVK